MWGVGTLLGPSSGGLFAQLGVWRWAFGALAILTVAVMVLVPLSLPDRSGDREQEPLRIPVWSLVILGSAAMAISVAGIQRSVPVMVVLLAAGVALVGVFIVVDRRMQVSVLPRTAYGPGPFKWIYVTLGVLMAATMADMYVPLYGQRLAGLVPLMAGFLAVALSAGWTVSEIVSASVTTPARTVRIVAVAPLVMAIGLGAAALSQVDGASPAVVAVWALSLLVTGIGVGMAWPHLSVWAMGRVDDPAQGTVAAAAINTVQLICGAFGAGLAGIVVNTVDRPDAVGATWLFAVFAGLAAVGGVASFRAGKGVGQ
jgi:hypothetical protein